MILSLPCFNNCTNTVRILIKHFQLSQILQQLVFIFYILTLLIENIISLFTNGCGGVKPSQLLKCNFKDKCFSLSALQGKNGGEGVPTASTNGTWWNIVLSVVLNLYDYVWYIKSWFLFYSMHCRQIKLKTKTREQQLLGRVTEWRGKRMFRCLRLVNTATTREREY